MTTRLAPGCNSEKTLVLMGMAEEAHEVLDFPSATSASGPAERSTEAHRPHALFAFPPHLEENRLTRMAHRLAPSLSRLALGAAFLVLSAAPALAAKRSADVAPPSIDQHRYHVLREAAPRLDPGVLGLALSAAECARRTEAAPDARYLAVIDYSLPSTKRRFWLFDLVRGELVARELVAHGVNTGENLAKRFSNVEGSRQSSLGLFRTAETYYGRNGFSLRLDGLEEGVNDLARPRTIVMHGAWYVSDEFAEQHGRLGRSWGCPALDRAVSRKVLERIQDGQLLFSYYPDEEWLKGSEFLSCPGDVGREPVVTTADEE